MRGRKPGRFTISAVAEMLNIHPQTLRMYEREGLIEPERSAGNTRYYTDEQVQRLETILHYTRDMGMNLAGVDVVLQMRSQIEELQGQIKTMEQKMMMLLRYLQSQQSQEQGLIPVSRQAMWTEIIEMVDHRER